MWLHLHVQIPAPGWCKAAAATAVAGISTHFKLGSHIEVDLRDAYGNLAGECDRPVKQH